MGASDLGNRRLAVEAATFGVGYASLLCWASTALVGSFGGAPLSSPYWSDLPWLQTDTTGVGAFALAAVSFIVSRYLRLRRSSGAAPVRQPTDRPAVALAAQATAETAALLATAIFVYLSINAVTHYDTMRIHLTHLLSWPSEGTVRVIALGICAVSVAVTRYVRSAGRDGQREILGDGRVRQVEQPAASPDLETRLGGRVDPG
jgi:hypothetical protein